MCRTEKNTLFQKEFLIKTRHLAPLFCSTNGVFSLLINRKTGDFQDKVKFVSIIFILYGGGGKNAKSKIP